MKEEDYIKQKELSNQPKFISIENQKLLLDIMKTHVCKIYCKDGSYGTGFFCLIPIGWGNYLPVLMTNNQILNINDIQPGKTIKFTLDNDKKKYEILIDNIRKTYINQFYNVTIIEIKEDDQIDERSFFNVDMDIFKENVDKKFKNRLIYLLHYPKGKGMEISTGTIKNIKENEGKKTIYHLCDSDEGSSGGPIINISFLVIGIHIELPTAGDYNLGILLKEPIEQFIEEIKKEKKNK